jgi:hypothetical protein
VLFSANVKKKQPLRIEITFCFFFFLIRQYYILFGPPTFSLSFSFFYPRQLRKTGLLLQRYAKSDNMPSSTNIYKCRQRERERPKPIDCNINFCLHYLNSKKKRMLINTGELPPFVIINKCDRKNKLRFQISFDLYINQNTIIFGHE